MRRRRLKIRHGRPRKAQAKRRATTAAGRAPDRDHGSPELLHHRIIATGTEQLPDDILGVLFGRQLIDPDAYLAGREFAVLVRLARLGLGLTEASAAGAWRNILAATGGGRVVFDYSYPGAERARRALDRFRRDLGQRSWQAVTGAVDNLWPSVDRFGDFVADLRIGLGYLTLRLPLSTRAVL